MYVLDLKPLLSSTRSGRSFTSKKMEWVKPLTKGPCPPRRAGHSAVAMGCQILIFGGANGNRYLSDLYILHTPTATWSCVALGPSASLGSSVSADRHEDDDPSSPPSWAQKISKRIKPALLPISPNQLIIFGGGKVCDFSAPTFGAIPTDCYLIQLSPASQPTCPTPPENIAPATKKKRMSRK